MQYIIIRNWFIAAAAVVAIGATCVQAGLADNSWGNGKKWGTQAQTNVPGNVKRSEFLMNNDSLLPGQNRTQAMRLEAETGHLSPYADSVIDPMIKKTPVTPPIIQKRTSVKMVRSHYYRNRRH